jgi:hypothetical protein
MSTIHCFPAARSLDPSDLEIAASVYVKVVRLLELPADDEASHERVAQNVIERMLLGERDPMRLRDEALARLGPASRLFRRVRGWARAGTSAANR